MEQQMSMAFMEDGGLQDDGAMQDAVSGNEVPSGSMDQEVRDDVPAMLSEGEYVVPADVVRFHGVKLFEQLRDEAKMGMGEMEQDGRIGGEPMGGSADMEDDMEDEEFPFSLEELEDIDNEPEGMAEGGMVYAAEGTFTYTPNTRYGQRGQSGMGLELRTLVNPATGRTLTIPFYNGRPMTVIPEGFVDKAVADEQALLQQQEQEQQQQGTRRASAEDSPFNPNSPFNDRNRQQRQKPLSEMSPEEIQAYSDSMDSTFADITSKLPIIGTLQRLSEASARRYADEALRSGKNPSSGEELDMETRLALQNLLTRAKNTSLLGAIGEFVTGKGGQTTGVPLYEQANYEDMLTAVEPDSVVEPQPEVEQTEEILNEELLNQGRSRRGYTPYVEPEQEVMYVVVGGKNLNKPFMINKADAYKFGADAMARIDTGEGKVRLYSSPEAFPQSDLNPFNDKFESVTRNDYIDRPISATMINSLVSNPLSYVETQREANRIAEKLSEENNDPSFLDRVKNAFSMQAAASEQQADITVDDPNASLADTLKITEGNFEYQVNNNARDGTVDGEGPSAMLIDGNKIFIPYKDGVDANGRQLWSVGYGHQLRGDELDANNMPVNTRYTESEVDRLFEIDVKFAVDSVPAVIERPESHPPIIIKSIAEMIYQMGLGNTAEGTGVRGFEKMLEAINNYDYETARREALDSDWAKQTVNRASRVASQIASAKSFFADPSIAGVEGIGGLAPIDIPSQQPSLLSGGASPDMRSRRGTTVQQDFVPDLAPAPQFPQAQQPFMPTTPGQMPQANVPPPLDPRTPVGAQDPSEVQQDFVPDVAPAPQVAPPQQPFMPTTPGQMPQAQAGLDPRTPVGYQDPSELPAYNLAPRAEPAGPDFDPNARDLDSTNYLYSSGAGAAVGSGPATSVYPEYQVPDTSDPSLYGRGFTPTPEAIARFDPQYLEDMRETNALFDSQLSDYDRTQEDVAFNPQLDPTGANRLGISGGGTGPLLDITSPGTAFPSPRFDDTTPVLGDGEGPIDVSPKFDDTYTKPKNPSEIAQLYGDRGFTPEDLVDPLDTQTEEVFMPSYGTDEFEKARRSRPVIEEKAAPKSEEQVKKDKKDAVRDAMGKDEFGRYTDIRKRHRQAGAGLSDGEIERERQREAKIRYAIDRAAEVHGIDPSMMKPEYFDATGYFRPPKDAPQEILDARSNFWDGFSSTGIIATKAKKDKKAEAEKKAKEEAEKKAKEEADKKAAELKEKLRREKQRERNRKAQAKARADAQKKQKDKTVYTGGGAGSGSGIALNSGGLVKRRSTKKKGKK